MTRPQDQATRSAHGRDTATVAREAPFLITGRSELPSTCDTLVPTPLSCNMLHGSLHATSTCYMVCCGTWYLSLVREQTCAEQYPPSIQEERLGSDPWSLTWSWPRWLGASKDEICSPAFHRLCLPCLPCSAAIQRRRHKTATTGFTPTPVQDGQRGKSHMPRSGVYAVLALERQAAAAAAAALFDQSRLVKIRLDRWQSHNDDRGIIG